MKIKRKEAFVVVVLLIITITTLVKVDLENLVMSLNFPLFW